MQSWKCDLGKEKASSTHPKDKNVKKNKRKPRKHGKMGQIAQNKRVENNPNISQVTTNVNQPIFN